MIGALALAAALAAAPAGARPDAQACLSLADSAGTHYHPVDDHTVVIESFTRWWRLTTTRSPLLLWPDTYFVNEVRGVASLCSPVDFDLSIVQRGGFREPVIAQAFTPIAAEEGKALVRAARR